MITDKLYLEFYNNKYCRIPTNLTSPENPGVNYTLAYWIIRKISSNQLLTKTTADPVESGFLFKAVDREDSSVLHLQPGDTTLSDMLTDSETAVDYVTLKDLGDSDIDIQPVFKEHMWISMDLDGTKTKVYNEAGKWNGTFSVTALNTVPAAKEGYVWDGWYFGNTKVDGSYVFQEREAGMTITGVYNELQAIVVMNGSNEIYSGSQIIGSTFTPTDVTVPGFRLEGYYTDSAFTNKLTFPITIDGPVTIYAKYIEQVTAILYSDVDMGELERKVMDIGTEWTPATPTAPELGYIAFKYVVKDTETEVTFPYVCDSNVELVIQWTREQVANITVGGTNYPSNRYTRISSTEGIYNVTFTGINGIGNVGVVTNAGKLIEFTGSEEPTEDVTLDINTNDMTGTLSLVTAAPVSWTLTPAYGPDSYVIKEITPTVINLEYYTHYKKYRQVVSLPQVTGNDFEEKDSQLALDGRVFSDIGMTTAVVSPAIDGNVVTADFNYGVTTTLPSCYINVGLKDTMTVSINTVGTDTSFNPKTFTVGTGQSLSINESMFTGMTVPDGYELAKFTYIDPTYGTTHEVEYPGEITNIKRSIELIPVVESSIPVYTVQWVYTRPAGWGLEEETTILRTERVRQGEDASPHPTRAEIIAQVPEPEGFMQVADGSFIWVTDEFSSSVTNVQKDLTFKQHMTVLAKYQLIDEVTGEVFKEEYINRNQYSEIQAIFNNTPPEHEGYTFDGWDPATLYSNNVPAGEITTVTAKYILDPEEFTVTWVDSINGLTLKTETLAKGEIPTPPAAPDHSDYVFVGWDQDYTKIKKDTTVRTEYQSKTYFAITFSDSPVIVDETDTTRIAGYDGEVDPVIGIVPTSTTVPYTPSILYEKRYYDYNDTFNNYCIVKFKSERFHQDIGDINLRVRFGGGGSISETAQQDMYYINDSTWISFIISPNSYLQESRQAWLTTSNTTVEGRELEVLASSKYLSYVSTRLVAEFIDQWNPKYDLDVSHGSMSDDPTINLSKTIAKIGYILEMDSDAITNGNYEITVTFTDSSPDTTITTRPFVELNGTKVYCDQGTGTVTFDPTKRLNILRYFDREDGYEPDPIPDNLLEYMSKYI